MKIWHLISFGTGCIIGISIPLCYQHFNKSSKPNTVEIALGEVFYEQLGRFADEWDIHQVTAVMEELVTSKRHPQEQEKRDWALIDCASKKSEEIAQQNLRKAEDYLSLLSQKAGILEIVKDRVYVEILQHGNGEDITANDTIRIFFKEYDREGTLLKDTKEDKAYAIPLSQMIKGFKLAMHGAKVGERRKLYIHPDYGFGKIGRGREPNQLLIYEVAVQEKISQRSDADAEKK